MRRVQITADSTPVPIGMFRIRRATSKFFPFNYPRKPSTPHTCGNFEIKCFVLEFFFWKQNACLRLRVPDATDSLMASIQWHLYRLLGPRGGLFLLPVPPLTCALLTCVCVCVCWEYSRRWYLSLHMSTVHLTNHCFRHTVNFRLPHLQPKCKSAVDASTAPNSVKSYAFDATDFVKFDSNLQLQIFNPTFIHSI